MDFNCYYDDEKFRENMAYFCCYFDVKIYTI